MFRVTGFSRWLVLFCLVIVTTVHAQTLPQPAVTAEKYTEAGIKFKNVKEYDKAIESFKQAIKLDPNSAVAYHELGGLYITMGRATDALEPMKTAARLDPNNSLIHLNLGAAYANLRRPDDALAEMNIAKQLNPNDARIYFQLGNVLHNFFGRFEDALAMDLEARRLDPNVPSVHHNIGLMLMRLGRFSEAIPPLQEALRLDPKFRNAQFLLSDAYSYAGRYLDAADSFTKFLEIVPNGPEALTKRSWNYLYAGDHGRQAAESARAFLKNWGWKDDSSAYPAIMANLGYRDAGMNEEAKQVIVEAVKKVNPDKFTYSIVRYLNQEISEDELLKLATDNDKKTEAHAYLGMDLRLKDKPEEARAHYIWVKEYGNKRFFEYPLAIEELKRLN